ncbi:MAG: DUF1947 domain-containing protein [Candidatus Woesearchaeota archaeon]
MSRVTLNKRDVKELNKEIQEKYGVEEFFGKDDKVSVIDDTYILRYNELVLFYKEDLLLPTLRLILQDNFLKKVVVDMGAVPFAAKGADMMRPGIIEVDTEVEQDDIVAIVDEKNRKPIAIGQTLFSKDEMLMMDRGKMVLNIHHVGDDIWKMGSPD